MQPDLRPSPLVKCNQLWVYRKDLHRQGHGLTKEELVLLERECQTCRLSVNMGRIHRGMYQEGSAWSQNVLIRNGGVSMPEMALASPWPDLPSVSVAH